jgi:hypothetical protein
MNIILSGLVKRHLMGRIEARFSSYFFQILRNKIPSLFGFSNSSSPRSREYFPVSTQIANVSLIELEALWALLRAVWFPGALGSP